MKVEDNYERIYRGKIDEVIEMMKKDIENETKENENMVDDQKH